MPLIRRFLCSVTGSSLPPGLRSSPLDSIQSAHVSDQELWVSYTDPATVRKRLIHVAQQVRQMLPCDALPDLVLPHKRVRHGFWFMRFENEAASNHALQSLNGANFSSECGSMQGTLQLDLGDRRLDVRAMLNAPRPSPDPVNEWLLSRFGPFGHIEAVRLPRLKNNWDSGFAFVKFTNPEDAEKALEALDGTPSLVPGCNIFVDHAFRKPLYELQSSASIAIPDTS